MFLASRSPQRKSLLESLGIVFEIVLPEYDEVDPPHASPSELVERHSLGKARSVLPSLTPLPVDRPVLGVDTMVVIDGEPLGKAADKDEALEFLTRLSANTHEVYSGLTMIWADGRRDSSLGSFMHERTGHSVTEVRFSAVPNEELERYVSTGEWQGRAGAYAIQERASAFIEEVRGDYTNVVGLPVPLLVSMLRDIRLWPPFAWKPDSTGQG